MTTLKDTWARWLALQRERQVAMNLMATFGGLSLGCAVGFGLAAPKDLPLLYLAGAIMSGALAGVFWRRMRERQKEMDACLAAAGFDKDRR